MTSLMPGQASHQPAPASTRPTERLRAVGQSLWLDNITRTLLDDGTLQRYIAELSVTGLTSNPTIFQRAMMDGDAYDAAIAAARPETGTEALFNTLALADLTRAAKLLEAAHDASDGLDGWVSMEVSPLLADDAAETVAAARQLHAQANCRNLFIKIPGTEAGVRAIEEATFAGIPVNVTLLFSRAQYEAAANAWMRGIERRIAAGLSPHVPSVASLFVSRWDVAANPLLPGHLCNRLGIAVATHTWVAWRRRQETARWQRLAAAGAPTQRLLWASTGTKDPNASDVLYVEALAAPGTINTLPDQTLLAFADHGRIGHLLSAQETDCEVVIAEAEQAGVDVAAMAGRLQDEGAAAFVKSWRLLMASLDEKRRRS